MLVLLRGWLDDRIDSRQARIKPFGNPLDGPPLAGRVGTLHNDDQRPLAFPQNELAIEKLQLMLLQNLLIFALVERF
jgi:hypothetical protein